MIGDYHRRFGETERAKGYWNKAKAVEWVDEDGQELTGSDYINGLIEERQKMIEDDD